MHTKRGWRVNCMCMLCTNPSSLVHIHLAFVYAYQLTVYKERQSQREREDKIEKGWTDIQTCK